MNWFFHNPVADMPGPLFLCFYALVLTGAYWLGRWRLWDRDKTDELPSLRIPSVPDAYTTAYLADGSAGLRDTVLTSLILREYLEVESELGGGLRIRAKVGHPEARHLHPVEKRVFDFCAGGVAWPGSPRALNPALHASDCAPLEAVLVQMQALRPLEQSRREAKALLLPSWCLFWVGPYKMGVALMKGHTNVVFLVLLCMVGSAALKSLSNSWRRTRFGDRMLGEMRTTFRSFLNRLEALLAEGSPLIPTLVALYGRSILRISEHPSLRNLAFQGQFRSGFVSGDGGGGCGSVGGGGGDSGCGGGSGCGGCGGGD